VGGEGTGPEIANACGYSPTFRLRSSAAACTRYKALGIWGSTPILPRAGYDRLRDGLVTAASFRQALPSRSP